MSSEGAGAGPPSYDVFLFLDSTIRFLDELLSFSRVLMAFVEWV